MTHLSVHTFVLCYFVTCYSNISIQSVTPGAIGDVHQCSQPVTDYVREMNAEVGVYTHVKKMLAYNLGLMYIKASGVFEAPIENTVKRNIHAHSF